MDLASLIIGVGALAGVIEDFVSILARIDAAKSIKRDYDVLVVQLAMQKRFLDDLAKEVQIPDPKKNNESADGPDSNDLIIRAIECVRNLLEDGERLQQRYGIRSVKIQESLQSIKAPSNRSVSSFYRMSQKFRSLRDVKPHQPDQPTSGSRKNKHSGIQKLTWATKDKQEFENLEKKITALIQLICLLIPPSNIRLVNALQRNGKGKLRSFHDLEIVENVPSKKDGDISPKVPMTVDTENAKHVLNRLWFRVIDDRKNDITDAYSETFEWAIRGPAPETKWDDLRQWLRSGNDIYWISGKPGSGKSTLMKYLFEHPEVAELLEEWAGNQKLTMAAFFLWNVGTSEQNTQYGLARGLLYHVLEENQSLIPVVLPGMWREAQNGSKDIRPPSSAELNQAFKQLGRESTDGVFAFFIDGIDEFRGNHGEGISFIRKLANSAHIKILLSSREINECDKAFSSKPKMRLQDLTKKDIERYVNGTIRSHLSLPETSKLSETDIRTLIVSLLDKAEGVFFWVVLACQTLGDCFYACEKAKKLQEIVDELPQELEDLFCSILESVPRAKQQDAAKLLRLYHILGLHYCELEYPITTFSVAWAYEKDMSLDKMHDFTRFSLDEMRHQCKTFEVRLRSLCKGLLEVHGDTSRDYEDEFDGGPSYVGFMHRTVFEFLDSPGVMEMDCLKIHDEEFDPVTIIAYMYAYQLYLSQESVVENYEIMYILSDPLNLVSQFSPSKLPQVLDRLVLGLMEPRNFEMLRSEAQRNQYLPVCLAGTSSDKSESFFGYSQHELSMEHAVLLLAVELHLHDFVKDLDIAGFNALQISQHPDATERRNLLFHAIEQPMIRMINSDFDGWLFSVETVETLLDSGCDPNQIIVRQEDEEWDQITTPWHAWLSWLRRRHFGTRGVPLVSKASFITAKMLEAGADLCPKISTSHGDLRVYLCEELSGWMELAREVNSEEFWLQIRESCLVVHGAIMSSVKKTPIIIDKSDKGKEDENDGDEEHEDRGEDQDNGKDDQEEE